ncbi:unnamed protein product [Rotaria sp. Silwood1]|nr:unnamed protein product [Rotaria sp. Silwood1]CAF4776316.1 unnamed protein product [Rotaria sp. Silwood1]
MCLQDAPSGVGDGVGFVTSFPGGIHTAAMWDKDLMFKRASIMGQEFREKGVNIALGPMINIDRNALHGRNWEGFGSDPYLSGMNAYQYVLGLQDQGVVATPKHYIGNEQETNRLSDSYSANIDDKTVHEIYLWPFADAVYAGAGSVMCSYNRVNQTHACQNNKTLNGLLKNELAYRGNVMSDWGATHAGVESALGGLDIEMPGGSGFMGYALLAKVHDGSLSEARVNDMVTRIFAPYFLLEQDQSFPKLDWNRDVTHDHYKVNRELARAGMILLKNLRNTLPLNASVNRLLTIFGAAATQYDGGLNPGGGPTGQGYDGAIYQGGGSGFVKPTYGVDPLSALLAKARDSNFQIQFVTRQTDFDAVSSLASAPLCLVFISAWSSEGSDRQNLNAWNQGDKLVQTVAAKCASTIVLVNSVSQLNLEAWVEWDNVSAVIWTAIPGSEYGNALVDILFGDYNPGGKLAFTIAKKDSDYGTNITQTPDSNYTEGVFLDYRHFDAAMITPRFHFGYGLSYTTFSLTELKIAKVIDQTTSNVSDLYTPAYIVSLYITNTGNVRGSEVVQLYLGFPDEAAEPPKVLRGFSRVYLEPGETMTVTLTMRVKDISYWNVITQQFTVANGNYKVYVGTSANWDDLKLQGSFIV